MQLGEFLWEYREELLARWVDAVLATYAPDAHTIFKRQKDRFANPIGHKVREGLTELLRAVCRDEVAVEMPALEELIKVRAVQQFAPGESIAFVFQLKQQIGEQCKKGKLDLPEEMRELEARIDIMALRIFDLYMMCRERLFKIRLRELESGNSLLADSRCPNRASREEAEREEKVN